jgi:hemoglobin/transferrin/lactoferrin receptor protein
MNKRHYVLGLSLAASLCLLPNIAFADAFVTLESVTLIEDESSGIGEAKIISNEKLQKTQAKEMKDVFKGEPSVSIGGGSRNAQRIYLRGVEGTNLNITIDGAKQGGSLHQHAGDIGGIDPALLKSVEVSTIAGADSGSGALGGSLVLETVDAQDLLKKEQNLGAMLRGGYFSASSGYSGGVSVYGRIDDYSALLFDISGLHQDDYRTGGGGDALNSAVKDSNYFIKYSLLKYHDHSLKIGATHNQNEGDYLYGGAGSDMGVPTPSQATSDIVSSRDTYTIDHRYNPQSDFIDIKTNLYFNKRTLENKTSTTEVFSENVGGNIKNKMTLITGDFNHIFTYGGDYNVEDGKSKTTTTNKKISSKTLGLFAQGSTNYSALTFHYGVRFDDYEAKYSSTRTFSGHEFSPNFGLDFEVMEGLNLFANYSESIKIGSIVPVGWLVNTTATTKYNGSVDGVIKPETSEQVEVGVRYKSKGVFTQDDSFSAGVSVFKTIISDLVYRGEGGGGPVLTINNETLDIESYGFELKTTWALNAYKTSLSFLHVDTEYSDGTPIITERRKAASIGDTFIWDNTWGLNHEIDLGYTLTSVSKLDDIPVGYEKRPGYVLHDIYVEYRPDSIKDLTLNLAVNNIFDKEYYAHTSIERSGEFVEETGRDIRLSFKYKF